MDNSRDAKSKYDTQTYRRWKRAKKNQNRTNRKRTSTSSFEQNIEMVFDKS